MTVRKDYRTSDLYFAAYLKAIGMPFQTATKVGRKTFFVFENTEEIKGQKDLYFNRQGQVSALTYADELKVLKSLCYL